MNRPSLDRLSMLDDEGARHELYPLEVNGRFAKRKAWIFGALIVVYVALPWIPIGGHPAVFLDIVHRRFFLFGRVFNAQDFYLFFFFMSAVGFGLILLSALFGRVWCGYACPQTVFLEGVFRRVERWIEGDGRQRRKLDAAPWSGSKVLKKAAKHSVYLVVSFVVAHVFLAYFNSVPQLFEMMASSPAEHPTAFGWAFGMTAVMHFNFWWFREQLCIVICPYGRLQSALQDDHTIVIGYDPGRGDPRGKKGAPGTGDCVDCLRCVQVCPTGIDIRNGLQLECVGCASCIDACDAVMDKIERPRGLVRYDSLAALRGEPRRFLRGRVYAYGVAGLVGLAVAISFFLANRSFEANLLRVEGAPYLVSEGTLTNPLRVHVVNKASEDVRFHIEPLEPSPGTLFVAQPDVTLPPFGGHDVPLVFTMPSADYRPDLQLRLQVRPDLEGVQPKELVIEVVGPSGPPPAPPTAPGGSL